MNILLEWARQQRDGDVSPEVSLDRLAVAILAEYHEPAFTPLREKLQASEWRAEHLRRALQQILLGLPEFDSKDPLEHRVTVGLWAIDVQAAREILSYASEAPPPEDRKPATREIEVVMHALFVWTTWVEADHLASATELQLLQAVRVWREAMSKDP